MIVSGTAEIIKYTVQLETNVTNIFSMSWREIDVQANSVQYFKTDLCTIWGIDIPSPGPTILGRVKSDYNAELDNMTYYDLLSIY